MAFNETFEILGFSQDDKAKCHSERQRRVSRNLQSD